MKKSIFTLLRAFMMGLLLMPIASCEEYTKELSVTPEVTIPNGYENYFIEDLAFGKSAAKAKVAFQINVDWTMQVIADENSEPWCFVDMSSGTAGLHKVLVSVSENDTYESRIAKIQLMNRKSKIAEIKVIQDCENVILLNQKDYNVSYEAGTFEVEFKTNIQIDCEIGDLSWVRKQNTTSRTLESQKMTFEVDENPYMVPRENYIYFFNDEYELQETLTLIQEGNPNGGTNFDKITFDGFFVYGEAATGSKDITWDYEDYHMAEGINEVTAERRAGMYEKYIVLEGGKEFFLVLNEAGEYTNYGSELKDYDVKEFADNPVLATVKRGELVTGPNVPAMKVDQTGLYHIVLDLNLEGDLLYPQIVVSNVEWGVRGAMNGWGFTAFDAVEVNAQTMTWKMENVDMPANGEFKFAYGHGWKIQLDDAGSVKANTNLGMNAYPNSGNIKVEKAGLYTITLTYDLNGGDITNSYTYTTECTQESALPSTLYMIGSDFGNWDWNSEDIVELIPVHSQPGAFWTTRYLQATTSEEHHDFKFCPKREWIGDFTSLGNDSGYILEDGNCRVAKDGFYTIYIDLANNIVAIEPAAVYGIGDCFGSWYPAMEEDKFVAEGTTLVSPRIRYNGSVRMYTATPSVVAGVDWWQMEFNVFDGIIECRGTGMDQQRVWATEGQRVVLDFNAGTGTIQ